MLETILHSSFVHGAIAGGLGVAARDLAMLLIGGIGMAFRYSEAHPNEVVTPGMEEHAKTELLTDIAQDAAKVVQRPVVSITVVPAKEPAAPPVPQYNQD